MSDYLPKELQAELREAVSRTRRRKAVRTVHVGDEAFPILDMREEGFAVDMTSTPNLRGMVDIFEGPRHLYRALIVAASEDGDLMRYDFKRNTAATRTAPIDFERSEPQAVPLLTKH